ncbi:PilZ domain-containing protein, partial [Billgrantia desiderata]
LGQEVYLLLTLPGESERVPVTGQVVWVSPDGVAGRRVPGIGIHFSPEDHVVRDRIETLLAGQLDKGSSSYTL